MVGLIDLENESGNVILGYGGCVTRQGIKLKGYYPYFGVHSFTFP